MKQNKLRENSGLKNAIKTTSLIHGVFATFALGMFAFNITTGIVISAIVAISYSSSIITQTLCYKIDNAEEKNVEVFDYEQPIKIEETRTSNCHNKITSGKIKSNDKEM